MRFRFSAPCALAVLVVAPLYFLCFFLIKRQCGPLPLMLTTMGVMLDGDKHAASRTAHLEVFSSSVDSSTPRAAMRGRQERAPHLTARHVLSESDSPFLFPSHHWVPGLRWVFVITPTYRRITQRLDLTRLFNTFGLAASNVHMIVVEDSVNRTAKVERWLNDSLLLHWSHLNVSSSSGLRTRGAEQRNEAIRLIRDIVLNEADAELKRAYEDSVVYFADDDNAYDIRILHELRKVRNIGTWPVGLAGARRVAQYCDVNSTTGKIKKYNAWGTGRAYPIDTAGFGLHVRHFLQDPPLLWKIRSKKGRLESDFLEQTNVSKWDIEPLADNCTKIYTWHVKTDIRWGDKEPPEDFDKKFDV
ncbi:unnamed protein product [Vitrella brassicaformis CCMP3155]|uniref:Galactosylgalactosylxylosylprotein 3-beta-glucuronosyltransferase n=1 Tax=Vitrella brassicaformis (strain CCMP3155) TaxID=1169540 RepID=A0A0G4H408_VITBC|nr:unnamed protein product [Vitrella brassicaformis CCMP3155]|eukprot:CEM38452.1 unnamed protein product [Vitrella brassicaformis CCMP3155]